MNPLAETTCFSQVTAAAHDDGWLMLETSLRERLTAGRCDFAEAAATTISLELDKQALLPTFCDGTFVDGRKSMDKLGQSRL